MADIDGGGLEKVHALLDPGRYISIRCDVAVSADYVAETVARFGSVDLLHSNAGVIGEPGPIVSSTPDNYCTGAVYNVDGGLGA